MEERPPSPEAFGEPPAPPPPPPAHGEPPLPPPTPAAPVIPWEQPGVDIFTAFFQTVRWLLASPRRAFERVPLARSIGRPFAFGLIVSLLAVWGDTFWQLVLGDWWKSMVPADQDRFDVSSGTQVIVGLCAPLWVPVFILLSVALQHLFLFVVGGARSGFGATLRATCYGWAPHMFALIPVCGQFVGLIWGLALNIIGLSVLHRITLGRAALAVLLPLILCCACIGIGLLLFGAAIFSAIGSRG